MSGLFGVFTFDRERRPDVHAMFQAARRLPHGEPYTAEGPGFAWLVQDGLAPASMASDSESRVYSAVLGRFRDAASVADELRQGGHAVEASAASIAIAAYRAWGLSAVHRLMGDYVLVLVDVEARALFLARDRLCPWPLYFVADRSGVAFSTRLQVLLDGERAPRVLDPEGAATFYRLGHVPSPKTCIQNVEALEPGSGVLMDGERRRPIEQPAIEFQHQDETRRLDDQLSRIEEALTAALPTGDLAVWLEGDLASTVLAAAWARKSRNAATTVGPQTGGEVVGRLASLLGSRHREVDPRVDLDSLLRLVSWMDQPLADGRWLWRDAAGAAGASQVMTSTGAGPAFAANPRYPDFLTNDAVRNALPDWMQTLLPQAGSLEGLSRPVTTRPRRNRGLNEDFRVLLDREMPGGFEVDGQSVDGLQQAELRYVTVDRDWVALHAWGTWRGIRVTSPCIDREVLDLASRLPTRGRMEGRDVGGGLRRMATRLLPGRLTHADFAAWQPPYGSWLRGALREAAETAFFGGPGGLSGLLDEPGLRRLWYEHQLGWRDHGAWLFSLLVFELWSHLMLADRSAGVSVRR